MFGSYEKAIEILKNYQKGWGSNEAKAIIEKCISMLRRELTQEMISFEMHYAEQIKEAETGNDDKE